MEQHPPLPPPPQDRAKIAADHEAFEPLLRAGASHEIVTTTTTADVVALLEQIAAFGEHQ